MLKKIFTVAMLMIFTVGISFAQWENQGPWPDTSYVGGTHGIAVDPDGKVWVASYFKDVPWVPQEGDTIMTSGILVFNPDGTEADFSPITTVSTSSGLVVDTLNGNCRGLGVDNEGNILYVQSSSSKIFKIDYKTGEGIARHDFENELGSSPTSPAVDASGVIYVGPVVGGGTTAIVMLSPDLSFLGNATVGPPAIGRTLEVSADGKTLYWMPFTAKKMYIYTRDNVFSEFAITDSALIGMSIESSAWNPADSMLWVSNDARGDGPYSHLTWYAFDVTTKTLVDSFQWTPATDETEYPRGLDFSPDGKIAYAGTFTTATPRMEKFVKVGTGFVEMGQTIPTKYVLKQNYPNPFNPSTVITFGIPEATHVTVKVYDVLGKEVATLLNDDLSAGEFSINFNAANLTSGMYIYEMTTPNVRITKKMLLMK